MMMMMLMTMMMMMFVMMISVRKKGDGWEGAPVCVSKPPHIQTSASAIQQAKNDQGFSPT